MRARLEEAERLAPGRSAASAAFWDRRARRFAAQVAGSETRDPLVPRLRRATGRRRTLLDVGAGSGRFALALAPHVREVVAVDQSSAMVSIIRREARRRGLANVRTAVGRWEEVEVERADVVLCSYVLPLVEDAAGFLRKLDGAARARAFLYLNAASADLLYDAFWRHFHGAPRRPAPTWLDAVAVLRELGADPEVEVVELPATARYRDLRSAVRSYAEWLLLPDGAEARGELRRLLSAWLVEERGELRSPVRSTPAAIISWTPTGGAAAS